MPAALLLDTDPGIDDAVAIALAAGSPALSVVAVTTVYGNVEVERATRNAWEVLRRVGLRTPVISGAARPLCRPSRFARLKHGPEGLGHVRPMRPALPEPDRGAEAIVLLARQHIGLMICCLGPLTNLAHALQLDPALRDTLGPVFTVGGVVQARGTFTRWSEFNWWSDPEAAAVVLRSGLDLRVVPADVTRRMGVPRSAIDTLRVAAVQDEDARFWYDALRYYADSQRSVEALGGCIIPDPLAVALASDPALATWHEMTLSVSTTNDDHRGALRETADGARVTVALDVRAEDALALVQRGVLGQWLPAGALKPDALPGAAADPSRRDHRRELG